MQGYRVEIVNGKTPTMFGVPSILQEVVRRLRHALTPVMRVPMDRIRDAEHALARNGFTRDGDLDISDTGGVFGEYMHQTHPMRCDLEFEPGTHRVVVQYWSDAV